MSLAVKKFGIIVFLLGFIGYGVTLFLTNTINYDEQALIGYVIVGMVGSLVYFGVGYQRDTVNAGQLVFSQALFTGIAIAGLGALGMALSELIYTQYVNPAYFEQYGEYQLEIAKATGIDSKIALAKDMNSSYASASGLELSLMSAMMRFLATFTIGVLCAIFSAFILRKK